MTKHQLIKALSSIPDDTEIHVHSQGDQMHPEAREVIAVDFHGHKLVAYIRGITNIEIPASIHQSVRILHTDYPREYFRG